MGRPGWARPEATGDKAGSLANIEATWGRIAAEQTLGVTFPGAVRASFRRHDVQRADPGVGGGFLERGEWADSGDHGAVVRREDMGDEDG